MYVISYYEFRHSVSIILLLLLSMHLNSYTCTNQTGIHFKINGNLAASEKQYRHFTRRDIQNIFVLFNNSLAA